MMYMISRQGAKEIMKKHMLPDGRWNLLVCGRRAKYKPKLRLPCSAVLDCLDVIADVCCVT